MTTHLLALSIGPVQEFIQAARRTRDLWFGSHLLSEISRAAARAINEDGGRLIFPADVNAGNVANVLLAELDGLDPKTVAAEAKKAAEARWRKFATDAFEKVEGVVRKDLWDEQVGDVIEVLAHPGNAYLS